MTLSDDSLDIDEPKFDYDNISKENDLAITVQKETITTACLHSRFFAIGTLSGRIHIFDYEGIRMDRRELCPHLKPVNCISIDEKGEYLVSCSNDKLVVYGLCNSEHNLVLMTDAPMNVVAIDPQFHQAGNGRRFVSGDDRVILYERGFLARYKTTALQMKRQRVRTISWYGQFIAWATDIAVQIFDIEQRSIITRIKRDIQLEDQMKDQCQFCWKDKNTLLIGWGNTVKVCLIKERSHQVLNDSQLKELPKKYVEIVSMFDTEFPIYGLAPFNDSLFTLSIHIDTQSDNQSASTSVSVLDEETTSFDSSLLEQSQQSPNVVLIQPKVYILETSSNSYKDLSIETPKCEPTILTGYQTPETLKRCPYTLLSCHKDGIYLIIGQKDVISAKPRDYDDHFDWLIKHSLLKECYAFAKKHSNELSRHSVKEIEELYMEELLSTRDQASYDEAARLCSSICGSSQESWNYNIQKFCSLGHLNSLLPYLPKDKDGFHLNLDSYNYILDEFLEKDSFSFFKAVKEIPCDLYSVQSTADKVLRNLANDPKNLVLNEALAELYSKMGKFKEAVNIYLDFNDKTRIFSVIRENNLVSILRDRVDRLMQMDADETSQLLVENVEHIPMKDIVERLESYKSKRYLVSYLHRLFLKDPDSCIEYHDLMVKLYAQHQRESLLNFLKLSTNYHLEEALRICKEHNLIKEVVFLHGRMGDLREALKYITEEQRNIDEAIEFCKEHQDPELWQDLIIYSMDNPKFIGTLLRNIGTHINNPLDLIDRIPNGCEIEGLMPALIKILQDYQLQITLEKNRRDLMAKDCFNLLEKQIRCQTQGISIKDDQLCNYCNQPLFGKLIVDTIGQSRLNAIPGPIVGSSRIVQPIAGPTCLNDFVIFGCHHVFHEECCTDSTQPGNLDSESSNKILTCRMCILEKDHDSIRNN